MEKYSEIPVGRLRFEIKENAQRVFITAFMEESELNWLSRSQKDKPVAEAWFDVNGNEVYSLMTHALISNKGYGGETLKYAMEYFGKKGKKLMKGYVEHINMDSQRMLRKLGWKEIDEREHGSYWIVSL